MHKFLENVTILAASGRQNSTMIIDRRQLMAKINLYEMSRFHFYCWNQFKVIPLDCTLRTGTYVSPKVSLLMIRCGSRHYSIHL